MEIVEAKFNNLKQFISEKVGSGNVFVVLFLQSSLCTFLEAVYTHTSNGLTKKQIMARITEKLSVSKSDFPAEDWEKLTRYTEYFIGVAKAYYS